MPLRAAAQFAHPQFHCGKPPPAAAPKTRNRTVNLLLSDDQGSEQDRLGTIGWRIPVDFHAAAYLNEFRSMPLHKSILS
jgi:hypothetical protein